MVGYSLNPLSKMMGMPGKRRRFKLVTRLFEAIFVQYVEREMIRFFIEVVFPESVAVGPPARANDCHGLGRIEIRSLL